MNTTTGATLLCGTNEPPFFLRESISWPFESILSHGLDVPLPKHVESKFTRPAVVFSSTSNYYHWLIEELPLLMRVPSLSHDIDVLVRQNSITEKHQIVAQQLGFTPVSVPRVVNLKEQVMPGRANDAWFIHPEDYKMLSEFGKEATHEREQSGHEKIYVSRRNAQRSLTDEAQLEDILRARGFFVVSLESMSWLEQITLFQGANIVVGPHGAGLSNLVFSDPGINVLELTNGYHYNRCFEWICHVAGHPYNKIDTDSLTTPLRVDQLASMILDRT